MKKSVVLLLMVLFTVGCSKQPTSTAKKEASDSSTSTAQTTASSEKIKTEKSKISSVKTSISSDTTTTQTTDMDATVNLPEQASEMENSPENTPSAAQTFDLTSYLTANYPITGAHYTVSNDSFNNDTGRYEYSVTILPDTIESDKIITGAFQSSPEGSETTAIVLDAAKRLMTDLPKIDSSLHIHHVSFISYDGSYDLMLIQDRAQDTLK